MDEQFKKDIGLALLGLYAVDKYLYNVAARLRIQQAKSLSNDKVRGYTDGVRIYLTPAWSVADEKTRLTTVTHEVLHVICKHLVRIRKLKDINMGRMNVAADLSILDQQLKLNQNPPIKDVVKNWEDYLGLDMFEIYDMLTDEDGEKDLGHPEIGGGGTGDSDEEDTPSNGQGQDDNEDENQQGGGASADRLPEPSEKELFTVDSAIQQASAQAAAEGYSTSMSKSASRHIDDLRTNPIPWNEYLFQITSKLKSEIPTWSRPNRRMMSQVYLPSRAKKEQFEATVAMDVSGSVGEKALSAMGGIVQDILTQFAENVHLMTFDDKIVDEWELKRHDKIVELELIGYGGTYVQKVFDHLEKTEREPKLLVITTDGWIPQTKEPPYQVVWLITDNPRFEAPYGTVIHIQTEDL